MNRNGVNAIDEKMVEDGRGICIIIWIDVKN